MGRIDVAINTKKKCLTIIVSNDQDAVEADLSEPKAMSFLLGLMEAVRELGWTKPQNRHTEETPDDD